MSTYYVAASDGSNTYNGTVDHHTTGSNGPFLTITKGVSVLSAGDTLQVRTGTYQELIDITADGTSGSRITVTNYPGESPVIDGTYTIPVQWYDWLVKVSGDYVTFSNFSIIRSKGAALLAQGDYDILLNCSVNGAYECGICGGGTSLGNYNVVDGCVVTQSGIGYGINGQDSWGGGIVIQGHYDTIQNCLSYENRGEGLNGYQSYNATIKNSISYDNQSALLYLDSASDLTVYGNLAYLTKPGYAVNGILVGAEVRQPANYLIYNNFIYGCHTNFETDSNITGLNNINVYHNVFMNASGDAGQGYNMGVLFRPDASSYSGCNFQNNIVIEEVSGRVPISVAASHSGLTFAYNCWNSAPIAAAQGTGDVTGDPKLTKTGLVSAGALTGAYFKLQASSPAIDAGTNVGVATDYFGTSRPQGAGYDMGGHEYVAGGGGGGTPTPIWTKDFEDNSLADMGITDGGETCAIQTSIAHDGTHALRIHNVGSVVQTASYYIATTPSVLVGRFYVYFAAWPSGLDAIFQAYSSDTAFILIDPSTHKLAGDCAGTVGAYSAALALATEYRIDFTFDCSANPWTFDFQIDGVAQAQTTAANAATTISGFYCGNGSFAVTRDVYFDDIMLSATAGDYPLGTYGDTLTVLFPPRAFTLTGQSATLTKTGSGANTTLTAGQGIFSLAGNYATLIKAGVKPAPIADPFISDIAQLPDYDKLVTIDWELARELNTASWASEGSGMYSLAFTDGEVHRLEVSGAALTETFSPTDCAAVAGSFCYNLTGTLYVHTTAGDSPAAISGGLYKYTVMAYFYLGIANDGVILSRYRETLLDGKLDLWTSSAGLKRWTSGTSGTSALASEASIVYDADSAYSAKFTVGAVASQVYIRQDVTLRPSCAILIRLKYKCVGSSVVKIKMVDTGNNFFLHGDGTWSAGDYSISLPNSTSWTEYALSCNAQAGYSIYKFYVLCNTNGDTAYVDDVELKRYYTPAFYAPYLKDGAIPIIRHSVGDFQNPQDQLSFGTMSLDDDGFFAEHYTDYIWHNRTLYIRIGRVSDLTYDNMAPFFSAISRNPVIQQGVFTVDLNDARIELAKIPNQTFDATTYPHAAASTLNAPIPILVGEVHNFAPPMCDSTTWAVTYKLSQTVWNGVTYPLQAVTAVYMDNAPRPYNCMGGYTYDLNAGTITLQLPNDYDGEMGTITCDATGYWNNITDFFWFLLTVINSIPEDNINVASFNTFCAKRNLFGSYWFSGQDDSATIITLLKWTHDFFFFIRPSGEYYIRVLTSDVPTNTPIAWNEDYIHWEMNQRSDQAWATVSGQYNAYYDPNVVLNSTATDANAIREYGIQRTLTINWEQLYTTQTDADLVVASRLAIVKKPLTVVKATLPQWALLLNPTDKIYINKMIVDSEGVERTVYNMAVFVILSVEKDLSSATATIEAVQSFAALYWVKT